MSAYERFTALVAGERDRRANYKILASCIIPRPIAFVSTISGTGVSNLAPFSFFNGVSSNPPAVMFCPATNPDGTPKDTLANLKEVPEFVINAVPFHIREAMNETAYPYPPEVDEFQVAGLTPLPSRLVRPNRVAESPVHMECKLLQVVAVGEGPASGNICIGEVLCFHVAEEHLLADGTVNAETIDLVGRLGGDEYVTIRDRFSMSRPRGRR